MTLPRLLLAWLPVAAWFLLVRWAARGWLGAGAPSDSGAPAADVWVTGLEAAAVTLFASLWFDSLGAGGWWLLFLLVGALVAFAPRLRDGPTGLTRRRAIVLGLADVARYVGAGGLLAWRLE